MSAIQRSVTGSHGSHLASCQYPSYTPTLKITTDP